MAFRQNYNQQRAERNRAKQAKTQAKLEKRRAQSEARKASQAAADQPATPETPKPEDSSGT